MHIYYLKSNNSFDSFICCFYVPGSDSGDILFLPCPFVGWTTLTLVITFEPFEIELLYLACRFPFDRCFRLVQKLLTCDVDLDLRPTLKNCLDNFNIGHNF